jgi:hypothetical protein
MFIATLPPVSNRASWIESVELTDEETGEPIDLTGCDIEVAVRPQGTTRPCLQASTGDDTVAIVDTGVFQFTFTPDQMRSQCVGTYDVGATISRDGETAQIVIGSVSILDGVVR